MTVFDLLHGEVTGTVDDFVLRRNDGVPAYNLAVVVDDAESGIDQIVRGDDLLPAAINQAFLAALLGHDSATYAHVPLAVNRAGRRLAKRDGAVTLSDLARRGWEPADVLNLLARSLGLIGSAESADLGQLLDRFDPVRLPSQPWVVGPELPQSR